MGELVVKVSVSTPDGGEAEQFRRRVPYSFDLLALNTLLGTFSSSLVADTVTYRDEDGDDIQIHTDDDLREARLVAQEQGSRTLNLFVKAKNNQKEEQLVAAEQGCKIANASTDTCVANKVNTSPVAQNVEPSQVTVIEKLLSVEKKLLAARKVVNALEIERSTILLQLKHDGSNTYTGTYQTGNSISPSKSSIMDEGEKTRLSKRLSWVLRHGADKLGVSMDSDGYVFLDDLIATHKFYDLSLEKVRELLKSDAKGRFHLIPYNPSAKTGRYQIRATYGHTISVVTSRRSRSQAKNCRDEDNKVKHVSSHADKLKHLPNDQLEWQLQNATAPFLPKKDTKAALESKVRKQVEYYFSNKNLSQDKFLMNIADKNSGFVPIATLLTFNKMQQLLQHELPPNQAAIVASAVGNSAIVELGQGGTSIRKALGTSRFYNPSICNTVQKSTSEPRSILGTTPAMVVKSPLCASTIAPELGSNEKMLKQICKQLEFYFSEKNLKKDDFLRGIAERNNGYVGIDTLLTFAKIKEIFGKSGVPDAKRAAFVAGSIKDSKKVELNRFAQVNSKIRPSIRQFGWSQSNECRRDNLKTCDDVIPQISQHNPVEETSDPHMLHVSADFIPSMSASATLAGSYFARSTSESATLCHPDMEDLLVPKPVVSDQAPGEGDFDDLRTMCNKPQNGNIPSATYIGDVCCPDNSIVQAGDPLCKTWKFRNSGKNKWPTGTAIVQVKGDFAGASEVLNSESLPGPGEEVEVTLSLNVPPHAHGKQVGYFQLTTPDGKLFGHRVCIDIVLSDWSEKEKQIYSMGFSDIDRIRAVLCAEEGNMEKAVACLLELGSQYK